MKALPYLFAGVFCLFSKLPYLNANTSRCIIKWYIYVVPAMHSYIWHYAKFVDAGVGGEGWGFPPFPRGFFLGGGFLRTWLFAPPLQEFRDPPLIPHTHSATYLTHSIGRTHIPVLRCLATSVPLTSIWRLHGLTRCSIWICPMKA